MTSHKYSVNGNWHGFYVYAGQPHRIGFEAVFSESAGAVYGSILDNSPLGEAKITGSFEYPNLTFTKTYQRVELLPVTYQGVMSEDGKTLAGIWRIGLNDIGSWSAKRHSDDEELKSKAEHKKEEQEVLVEDLAAI
jgi:hypothetical protein